jgi:sulfur-oxidizing protein SoxZ
VIAGRLQVPPSVKKGEVFTIRVLVQHPMETGFRRDADGRAIPVNVIDSLACRYDGKEIFRAELGTGISANPYLAFTALATASGEIEVEYRDDRGERGAVKASLVVT